ncbi:MAG TPA: hypothetical protein PKO07_12995 [Pseudomonadota bacterium]|nr:hypothetical protein [Pseudomonadota bacterium]HNF96682.1 hypothetical protein [Pseudomonadota bacterium]HNN51935.1 hypothetical protein [Pseudomonadota bacterium]
MRSIGLQSLSSLQRALSRRGFASALLALLALVTSKVRGTPRRRRRGDPGPTGWFGHC